MKFPILACALAVAIAPAALHAESRTSASPRERHLARHIDHPSPIHRRRAYDRLRARAPFRIGVTCVTPKLVCWVPKRLATGEGCACRTRRFGAIEGRVGG